jgi:hypothetical protein
VLVGGKNPGSWYSDREILEIRTKAFEEAKKYTLRYEAALRRIATFEADHPYEHYLMRSKHMAEIAREALKWAN